VDSGWWTVAGASQPLSAEGNSEHHEKGGMAALTFLQRFAGNGAPSTIHRPLSTHFR
jgi:hypothetical protein